MKATTTTAHTNEGSSDSGDEHDNHDGDNNRGAEQAMSGDTATIPTGQEAESSQHDLSANDKEQDAQEEGIEKSERVDLQQPSQDSKVAVQPSNRTFHPGAVAVGAGEEEERLAESMDVVNSRLKSAPSADETAKSEDKEKLGTQPTIADINMPESSEMNVEVPQKPSSTLATSMPATTVIDNSHSVPMVEAELVSPPVEAFHVAIDEDPASATIATRRSVFEIESSSNEEKSRGRCNLKRSRATTLLLLTLVVVIALVGIMLPLVLTKGNDRPKHENGGKNTTGNPPSRPGSPTPAPTFSYPCYTSTYDILQSQRYDKEVPEAYIICPNTRIVVGTFNNPAVNDFSFVAGDYPIMAVRENVTIQCGIDGKVEDNCVFEGGFIQVLTVQMIPTPDGGFNITRGVDNFLVRGMTFSGQPTNAGPFSGNSVTLSHPGENIRFEDCRWTSFIAQNGLIGVYRNLFQILSGLPLEDQSVHATFSNCTFERIIYDLPLIHTDTQTVVLEQCSFRDVRLSILVQQFCFTDDFDIHLSITEEGCASLVFCGSGSTCSINDVCIENFEYKGPSVIFATDGANVSYSNLFFDDASNSDCQLGVAQRNSPMPVECYDIFDLESCPLL